MCCKIFSGRTLMIVNLTKPDPNYTDESCIYDNRTLKNMVKVFSISFVNKIQISFGFRASKYFFFEVLEIGFH